MILAPLFRRRTNESNEAENAKLDSNDSRALTGFRAVDVSDEQHYRQGIRCPKIGSINGDRGAHRERLEQFVREQGIALEYSEDIAPAKGVSEGGKIKLLPGQSPAETVATLVHEIAHERLHRTERRASTTKRIRETEAEAVAFVVSQAIGLETGTASADYISLWNGDAAVLLEGLELVQRTATEIIAAIAPDELSLQRVEVRLSCPPWQALFQRPLCASAQIWLLPRCPGVLRNKATCRRSCSQSSR